jgi:exopolysaccharide production protein ExoQ
MRLLEKVLAVSLFLFSMNFFFTVLYGKDLSQTNLNSLQTGEVHSGTAVIELLLYGFAFLFIVRRYRQFLVSAVRAWPLLAFGLFCLLSTVWSTDPPLTLRRSLFLLGTILFGVYLGGRYSIETLSRLLLYAFYVFCGFTLLYRVVAPVYVLDPDHGNALRGLAGHKNYFGECMAVFVLLAILAIPAGRSRLSRYGIILIAFVLLVASTSATSILACVVVACSIPLLKLFRLPAQKRWPAVSAAVMILGVFIVIIEQSVDSVLSAFGRDTTFTGRSTIWEQVMISISRRPLLGYGFDVFWQGLKGESLNVIAASGWLVPEAHNGYLDAALSVGIVGLLFFMVCIGFLVRDAIWYIRQAPGLPGLWPITFLMYYLIHALTESSLITRDSLEFLLIAVLYTPLSSLTPSIVSELSLS